jgi:hypothetical protein
VNATSDKVMSQGLPATFMPRNPPDNRRDEAQDAHDSQKPHEPIYLERDNVHV